MQGLCHALNQVAILFSHVLFYLELICGIANAKLNTQFANSESIIKPCDWNWSKISKHEMSWGGPYRGDANTLKGCVCLLVFAWTFRRMFLWIYNENLCQWLWENCHNWLVFVVTTNKGQPLAGASLRPHFPMASLVECQTCFCFRLSCGRSDSSKQQHMQLR